MDVTALGELLIDFTPIQSTEPFPMFEQNPGGAPGNLVTAVSNLGGSSAIISKVGNDQFGRFLCSVLRNKNVETKYIAVTDEAPTTMAFVHLDENKNSTFTFVRKPGADILLTMDDIDLDLLSNSKVFHFGSLSLTDSPARDATYFALKCARDSGCIISYDPNYRPALWNSEKTAVQRMLEGIEKTDLLKVNESEIRILSGCEDIEIGADQISHKYNLKLLVVTLGEKGCYFTTKKFKGYVDTLSVDAVDTTGAGDSFWGSFLYQMTRKNKYELLEDKNDLVAALKYANVVGAMVSTKRGGIPSIPSKDQVEKIINNKNY